MVSTMVVVIVALASLVVGLALGIWYASAGKSAEATKANAVQEAFDDYKSEVNAHFGETAKHFAAIGQEYRALYSHMASSAETLLGADSDISQDGFPRIASAGAAVTPNDDASARNSGDTPSPESADQTVGDEPPTETTAENSEQSVPDPDAAAEDETRSADEADDKDSNHADESAKPA